MLAGIAGAWLARVAARVERWSGRMRRWAEARAPRASSADASGHIPASASEPRSAWESSAPLDALDAEHGPPADWLARVRRGAPHLLVAMQRRRRGHGEVVRPGLPGARAPVAGGPAARVVEARTPRAPHTAAPTARTAVTQAAAADAQRPRDASSSEALDLSAPTARRTIDARAPSTRGPQPTQRTLDAEPTPPSISAEPAGRLRWIRWPGASQVTPPRRTPPTTHDVVAARAAAVARTGPRALLDTSNLYASSPAQSAAGDPAVVAPAARTLEGGGAVRAAPDSLATRTERSSRAAHPSHATTAREVPHLRSAPIAGNPLHRPPASDAVWPRLFPHSIAAPPPPAFAAARGVDPDRAFGDDGPFTSAVSPDPWPTLLEDVPSDPAGHATTPASADALQRVSRRQEGAPWSA
jgi:hypothetical protein